MIETYSNKSNHKVFMLFFGDIFKFNFT
uniref:Uncharacterized protein n=1 Tax=Anguilla anguilla TaxID=7936 RepID=A0A0E9SKX0_ANGAN